MAWVDGVLANNFTDADRNSNIQMMLLDLYNTESWDKRAACAAIGAAWAWGENSSYIGQPGCRCNPYYQWTPTYTFLYSGLWAVWEDDAEATNYPGTGSGQMDWFLSHPEYWDGSQVYGNPTFPQFYLGQLPTTAYNNVRQYTDVFVACYGWYRNWTEYFSTFRSLAEQHAEFIYNNFDRFINGYFTSAWLYMEMSKRKKGGGKLYL